MARPGCFISGRMSSSSPAIPMTADDVKFSFDRLVNLKDNPAALAENLKSIEVVDEKTVKLVMNDKTQPLLNILISPNFAIIDCQDSTGARCDERGRRRHERHGDRMVERALDRYRALSALRLGPELPNCAHGQPELLAGRACLPACRPSAHGRQRRAAPRAPARRHRCGAQPDPGADRQRGSSDPNIAIEKGTSLDFIYMTLTSNADQSQALSNQAARQAVAAAIDYDGIIDGLLGGNATRPPTFIPVGLAGITPELTTEIGYHLGSGKGQATPGRRRAGRWLLVRPLLRQRGGCRRQLSERSSRRFRPTCLRSASR